MGRKSRKGGNDATPPNPEPKINKNKAAQDAAEQMTLAARGSPDGIDEQRRLVVGWAARIVDGALESKSLKATSEEQVFGKVKTCSICQRLRTQAGKKFKKDQCVCPDGVKYTSSDKVVTILRKDLAAHSVIIAQSGSGKSYLLGSLLEEVVLRSRMDVTILDPNADFRLFCMPDERHLRHPGCTSNSPSYRAWNASKSDETCAAWWSSEWKSRVSNDNMTFFETASAARLERIQDFQAKSEPPRFAWEFFSPELLAAYEKVGVVDPIYAGQMRVIHDFVQQVSQFRRIPPDTNSVRAKDSKGSENYSNPSEVLDELKRAANDHDPADSAQRFLERLRDDNNQPVTHDQRLASSIKVAINALWDKDSDNRSKIVKEAIAPYEHGYKYFSDTAGLVKKHTNATDVEFNERPPETRTISIYDLLGAEGPGNRAEIAYLALRRIWKHATARFRDEAERIAERQRDRTQPAPHASGIRPHLIVIDEAHNLVPGNESLSSHPVAALLRDLIVTIAAEGRKFAIHLLLVTQRPEKVDKRVLSECVNQIILRVSSDDVLRNCAPLFNLNLTEEQIRLIKSFGLGHGLLAGAWARHATPADKRPIYFVGCGRRTREGSPSVSQEWEQEPVSAIAAEAYLKQGKPTG